MTINENANSLKNVLNMANPNQLADIFRQLGLGDILRSETTTLRKKAPVASSYQLNTLQAFVLPDDAKARVISRAYARAGGVTLGELAVQTYGTTPTTGQIAVAPNGDIVVLASDAWTSVDIVYAPEKCDPVEIVVPVASNVATLPAQVTTPGVVMLCEAEVLAGTSLGAKIVLVPGSSPSAGQCRLNLAKTQVAFNSGDAVTSVRLKLQVCSAIDVDALLTAQSTI